MLHCQDPKPWVSQHVMPILGKNSITKTQFQSNLSDFLSKYSHVHVIADWFEDIKHLCESFILGPGMAMNTPHMTFEVRRDLNCIQSTLPHNALADANAIAEAYLIRKIQYNQ